MSLVTPCLWFDTEAEEAAHFYVSVFPDSRITGQSRCGIDWPGGKAGDVVLVDFELDGKAHQAMNGGPGADFNDAVSLSVSCRDQAEVDLYWDALLSGGGEPVQCGWLRDRFGVRWQVVPQDFARMLRDGNPDQRARAMTAMGDMVKLDLATLKRAYEG